MITSKGQTSLGEPFWEVWLVTRRSPANLSEANLSEETSKGQTSLVRTFETTFNC